MLEYRLEGAFKWKRFTEENLSELTYTAKNLKKEEVYEFRVAAENKAGVGPYSDNSTAVKAKEPIGEWSLYSGRSEGRSNTVFINSNNSNSSNNNSNKFIKS